MFIEGKTIAVTGAGKGIGRSCIEYLIAQGANVAALTRSQEDVLSLQDLFAGKNFRIFQGNATSRNDLNALLELGCKEFGRTHGLVNNAGVRQRKKIFDITDEDWDNVIKNNLTSCFQGIQIFANHMAEQGGGSIVNVSSIVGMAGLADLSGYATSKAGLIGLTKAAATELATYKIKVNAVCPGFTKTSFAEDFETRHPELHQFTLERTPMGRWGEPEEIAHLITFLLSDLSSYITGGIYPVDGGWTAC